jgi:hypothetical protein
MTSSMIASSFVVAPVSTLVGSLELGADVMPSPELSLLADPSAGALLEHASRTTTIEQ